jgi:hypothetical protein
MKPKSRRAEASFQFRYRDDPIDIRALAEQLGVENGLLAEAASRKGCVVAGLHAAPFRTKRRIGLKSDIRSAVRSAEGRVLPVAELSGRMAYFGRLWEQYPIDLATHIIVKLGFDVTTTESGSFVSLS